MGVSEKPREVARIEGSRGRSAAFPWKSPRRERPRRGERRPQSVWYSGFVTVARRRIPAGLLVGALIVLSGACGKDHKPRPANVLLIVADTLRADRLGCYGYPRPTSPNIDALAARGTLYRHAYSQACWTVPSMISMMTGISVTEEETALPKNIPVLGELVAKQGFETAAFPANAVLTHDRGFGRGFEVYDEAPNVDGPTLAARFAAWHSARKSRVTPDKPARPWLAWVQFIDPHQPYEPKPEHNLFTGPRPDQAELIARWKAAEPQLAELSPNVRPLEFDASVARMTELSNLYDGEVRAVDDGVGRIVETLRAAGELDSTLIILCADHGEMLFEHHIQPYLVHDRIEKTGGLPAGVSELFGNGHRPWYFENLWNTPLILAGPGFKAGARIEGLAANLDIVPTILEALDVPTQNWLQGTSLFGGVSPSRDRVFAHGHQTSAVREKSGEKLIVHPRRLFLLEGDGPPPLEMYDLARDPKEEHDLASTHKDGAERLRGEVQRWKAANVREVETSTNEEQQKILRQMGYVDGAPQREGADEKRDQ